MKSIIICKDCGEHFKSQHKEGICAEISEIGKSYNIDVFLSNCMEKCPREKISAIILQENQVNDLKIEEFSLENIKDIITQKIDMNKKDESLNVNATLSECCATRANK